MLVTPSEIFYYEMDEPTKPETNLSLDMNHNYVIILKSAILIMK
jgi:hypothetical protein